MKWIKYFIYTLLLVITLVINLSWAYLWYQSPDYSGSKYLKGLTSDVRIDFDEYGVPHIQANSEEDAHFALGYIHASERLFQMEMIRRVAKGRLSEVLGPDFIETDRFFLTLQLEKTARESADLYLQDTTKAYVRSALAYQKGINAFIRNGSLPVEFLAMGIPRQEFEPSDMYLVVGFMSVGFAEGLKTDPILSLIKDRLGERYLESLAVNSIPGTAYIQSYDSLPIQGLSISDGSISSLLQTLPVAQFHGSNGWVLSGSLTSSGKPLLANDTHIGFSQPSVWYEAHLVYPGQNLYGHYAAGFPFAILGQNASVAWGITMLENDDMDFFIEKVNPEDSLQVWHDSAWHQMESRWEEIPVKNADPYRFVIQQTIHGPVINHGIKLFPTKIYGGPVSLEWEFTQGPSPLLEACYKLNHSTKVYEVGQAAAMINSPGLNIMSADTIGNIGWHTAARLWKRPDHVNPMFMLDGSGTDDRLGYFTSDYNPRSINPPSGYVYSANNQPDTAFGYFHYGYYLPEDRAMRIVQLLEKPKKDKWTMNEMKKMATDIHSPKDAETIKQLIDIEESLVDSDSQKMILDAISKWNGHHSRNRIEPTIYYTWLSNIIEIAMADELGKMRLRDFSSSAVMKRSFLKFLRDEDSPWWDDFGTDSIKEDRNYVIHKAFNRTIKVLNTKLGPDTKEWRWERVHTLTHGHPLGTVELLAPYFNVGPYEVPGGMETLNNLMFALNSSGNFPVIAGPALRKVVDLANIHSSESVLPTGQSGNLTSKHYDDQALMFATGRTRRLYSEPQLTEQNIKSTVYLVPDESERQ